MKGVDTWESVKQYIYAKSVGKEHSYKTNTGYCRKCNRKEYSKQYYAKNKTEINAKHKAKYAPIKEANRLQREQYYLEHKEEIEQKKQEKIERKRQTSREYGKTHKEQINAYRRQYYKNNENKRKAHYKRVAEYIRKRCEGDPEYREKRNAYYREYHKRKKLQK